MPKRKRPDVLRGNTYKIPMVCGNLFLRISKDKGDIIEVMGQLGKSGNCSNALLEGLCLSLSEAFKFEGMTVPEKIDMVEQIRNIRCSQQHKIAGGGEFKSCLDEIAKTLLKELEDEEEKKEKK